MMIRAFGFAILALLALLVGAGGAALAATPQGTWITNTAQIDYGVSATASAPVRALSNAADTQVAIYDTTGPVFRFVRVDSPLVDNGGCTVRFQFQVVDSSGVVDVLLRLGLLGLNDSTSSHDNGMIADTTAGDSLWNALVSIGTQTLGDTYRIRVTAYDVFGYATDTWLTFVVRDTSPSLALIRSLGWNMRDNMRIAGNAVTLSVDTTDTFSKVLFEYRHHSGGDWQACATGPWSGPNPDTTGRRWGIYWDLAGLADDTYLVRARAFDKNGNADPSPAFLRVVKDSRDSWIHEWTETTTAVHVRRQRYSPQLPDTSIVVEGTSLTLAPSALTDADSVWLRITVYRGAPPEAPAPSEATGLFTMGDGSYRRFEREDGRTTFTDTVTIAIPYVFDGQVGDEDRLAIYRYDTVKREWVKETASRVDKQNNLVWLTLDHFSFFAIFKNLGTSLSSLMVYPVPWKPNDGDPTTGTEYLPGVANTGICFENVPRFSKIRIYTTLGELVKEIVCDGGATVQWDARNSRSEKVASGVYIFNVTSPNGDRVTGKLVIIR